MGRPKKQKKSPASQVVFDEEERKKYLLGFHKRKLERREKAREELEERIKVERKKQKELKAQAVIEERKKAGLPIFSDQVVLKTKNVIETEQNEIVISDFSSSIGTKPVKLDDNEEEFEDRDWENDSLLKSVKADNEILKSKTKLSKESSLINERLTKLQKQKKNLDMSNSKKKKNYLKSKKSAKKNKAAKKFLVKDAKIKLKNRIKNAKKQKK